MNSTELAIAACGQACLGMDELAKVRQHSTARFSATLRPQLLKHSDEQTLAAAVALDRALDHIPAGKPDFSNWAVISGTRYLGRTAFATVIDKYKIDGPWGVSVQVIPHTSPHALASSLSLALASHGPCLGAANAPGAELQTILTAAALLTRPDVAGAWLVLSGWSGEACQESQPSNPRCHAAVLALVQPAVARLLEWEPLGWVGIEHADTFRPLIEGTDLLLSLTSGHLSGRQFDCSTGNLRTRVKFFPARNSAAVPAPHFHPVAAVSPVRHTS